MPDDNPRWACVTGATSGIGAVFARKFAEQGFSLLLTGRRRDKIEALAGELAERYGVQVQVEIVELSDERALESFAEKLRLVQNLEILVNNAGFAQRGLFHQLPFSEHEKMLTVHCLATARLTHAVLPNMIDNGRGAVINVSSMAALTPFPGNAMYGATKNFINVFTESIHLELQGTGINVQVLCPGMTRTDFHQRMGFDTKTFYKERGWMKAMSPEEVVAVSLKDLKKGKVISIPGGKNKFINLIVKLLPRPLISRGAAWKMQRRR